MKKGPTSDRHIIRLIRDGQIDYFSHLVARYMPRILSYVSSRIFDKTEAEDLVQNCFISLYKAIDRLDEDKPVAPYLFEIAKNELKMYYRSRKETVPLNEKILLEEKEEPAVAIGEVKELLKNVTPDQRQALEMVYDGYTYKEIAATLGKNINTVRTLIRRARLLLVSKYKPNENA